MLPGREAEHEEVVPPLLPSQLQLQGPVPLTAVAVPVLQKLVAGAVLTVVPLALPQLPLTSTGAVHVPESLPPLVPSQTQVHGPVPLTAVATPPPHKLVEGALVKPVPLAEPQVPLTGTGCTGAEHGALLPPLLPLQLQFQVVLPVSLTVVALPLPQRFVVGALASSTPLAEPQVPLTGVTSAKLQIGVPSVVLDTGLPSADKVPLVHK